MKNEFVCSAILAIGMCSCGVNAESPADTTAKNQAIDLTAPPVSAAVYATAENTDLRLTPTTGLTFQPASQPLETEIAVFVNPEKEFQSYLGIGGAITDAAAEVFSMSFAPASTAVISGLVATLTSKKATNLWLVSLLLKTRKSEFR